MARDGCGDNLANGLGRFEGHLGKLFGAAHMRVFHQHSMGSADLRGEVFFDLLFTRRPQLRSAGFDMRARHLRHAGCRRALTWGIGKHMQSGQVAFGHELEAIFKMGFGFGGKAGNDIGAKGHLRAQLPGFLAKFQRVIA